MDIGIIGLGVMGRNLALNMSDNGAQVALFDLWGEARTSLGKDEAFAKSSLTICESLSEFVGGLTMPRAILLMVKAGETVDAHIDLLLPLLSKGDIIIDGGNSKYQETEKRAKMLAAQGIDFVGLGVSGGETGARHGPSLMAGASAAAFERINPLFSAISAKAASDGKACFARLGEGGAGHMVKTVHNGIEYADMQLLAETVAFMRNTAGYDAHEVSQIMAVWNKGPLSSYLVEITSEILAYVDPETKGPLVDLIVDKAGQKGTGQWTAEAALTFGVAAPSLMEAVAARGLSSMKDIRIEASNAIELPYGKIDKADFDDVLSDVEAALLICKYAIYAQGLDVIKTAGDDLGWSVNLSETARIWRAGCIIRAAMLDDIAQAYDQTPDLQNLLLAPDILKTIQEGILKLRKVAAMMVSNGAAAPVLFATLSYIEGLFIPKGSASIIQAQRDYFGAHTYQRIDKEGSFHTEWDA